MKETKRYTYEECLAMLPLHIYAEYKLTLNRKGNIHLVGATYPSLRDFIMVSLGWSDTPQGTIFWVDYYQTLKYNESIVAISIEMFPIY